jgi:hypothetical protein
VIWWFGDFALMWFGKRYAVTRPQSAKLRDEEALRRVCM